MNRVKLFYDTSISLKYKVQIIHYIAKNFIFLTLIAEASDLQQCVDNGFQYRWKFAKPVYRY